MFFWNNENMTGRDGADVKEGNKAVIFVDNVGRNFFAGYFAEDAGRHMDILQAILENEHIDKTILM